MSFGLIGGTPCSYMELDGLIKGSKTKKQYSDFRTSLVPRSPLLWIELSTFVSDQIDLNHWSSLALKKASSWVHHMMSSLVALVTVSPTNWLLVNETYCSYKPADVISEREISESGNGGGESRLSSVRWKICK